MKAITVAALAGLLLALPAAYAEAPPAKSATEQRPDEMICAYEKTTGSHLGRRVCATRAAREKRSAEDRASMSDLRRSNGGGTNGPGQPLGR